jgi:hypothetical protein
MDYRLKEEHGISWVRNYQISGKCGCTLAATHAQLHMRRNHRKLMNTGGSSCGQAGVSHQATATWYNDLEYL